MSSLIQPAMRLSPKPMPKRKAKPAAPTVTQASANADAIACWNDVLTPKWLRFRHLLSGGGQVHSQVAFATLPVRPGDRVLDVGCGFGETTLELAERAGPEGSALGIDCNRTFLDIAAAERNAAGQSNAFYQEGDIETLPLPQADFDLAVSRFGIMFCASPVRALRCIRRALRGGGVLGLLCWRTLADNPCWGAAEQVVLEHLPRPEDPVATCGPGPFAMAHEATNQRVLSAAGFEGVRHRRIDRPVCVGRDLTEALQYQLLVGPAGFVMREAGPRGQAKRDAVVRDLQRLLEGFQRPDGSIWMDSSTWLITARAPTV